MSEDFSIGRRVILGSLLLQGSADVDEVVGNHAKPDPALHGWQASIC